jgi:hypothetical protein
VASSQFCSRKCRWQSDNARRAKVVQVPRPCITCEEIFEPFNSRHLACSRRCCDIAQRKGRPAPRQCVSCEKIFSRATASTSRAHRDAGDERDIVYEILPVWARSTHRQVQSREARLCKGARTRAGHFVIGCPTKRRGALGFTSPRAPPVHERRTWMRFTRGRVRRSARPSRRACEAQPADQRAARSSSLLTRGPQPGPAARL